MQIYVHASIIPFYLHGLTLILAWISNQMPSKVLDEITYTFLNFIYPPVCNGCNYLSMLGSKLNHVSKEGPKIQQHNAYGWLHK